MPWYIKFSIRLATSILGAKLLMHFFRFLGQSDIMWLILSAFLLATAYGAEALRVRRLK